MVRWTSDIATATGVEPFTVLVRVGAAGATEGILAWPDTKVAQRLKAEFPLAGHPKPPGPSWWVKLDVKIRLKDADRGGEAKKPANPQFDWVEGSGVVYSGKLGVMLSAPKGWVLDNKSGVSQGTHAVMYPKGSSWRNAPEVIYVTVHEMAPGETLLDLITRDIAKFKKEFLGIKVEELEPVALRNGKAAFVRSYSGGAYPSFECVAYAQYGTGAAVYVLTCRTQAGYEKTADLFRRIVARSYPVNMRSDGKTPIVTLNEPEAPVNSVGDQGEVENSGLKNAGTAPPLWRQGGYSYWSRFKSGSYVTFRYSLKSAASAPDMLKTITLREVRPDSVVLEFKESSAGRPERTPSSSLSVAYQRSRFEFLAADEDFQNKDLFGGQLSFSPTYILEDSRGEKIGEGVEVLDWKGVDILSAWKKIRFGGPSVRTTVTIWLSEAVPGMVARMVRELEGGAAFTEEFVIDDFKAIRAEPADIERLRAERKPVLIEIPASSYVGNRFRFTENIDAASRGFWDAVSSLWSNGNADWVDDMTKVSPFPAKFRDIERQLEEDEKRAAKELEKDEAAKLRPLIEQMKRLAGLHARLAEIVVDFLSKSALTPPDPSLAASMMEEPSKIMGEITAARANYLEEYKKVADTKIKFLKKPGG
jgi:hypothetical protein